MCITILHDGDTSVSSCPTCINSVNNVQEREIDHMNGDISVKSCPTFSNFASNNVQERERNYGFR